MDPASVSALAVLGGSLVGALTSLASTWLTQQHLDRREVLGKQLADRETLYASFIAEASRAVIDALSRNLDHLDGLVPLYALVGRIRLSSSELVLAAAERVVSEIVNGYARPNLTAVQFQDLVFSEGAKTRVDPLAEFSQVCREELRALREGGNFRKRLRGPVHG